MKQIKSTLSLTLALLMLCMCLAGCGSTASAPAQPEATATEAPSEPAPETITLNALFMKQAGYSEEEITAITEKFMADHPNIKINLTFVAYEELEPKILTSAQSGSYDVVLGDCIWPAAFAQAKLVLDVTDRVQALDLDDIFQGALDACMYDGHFYGIPWLNDVQYMFYNEAMLEEAGIAGPPATWDELLEDAKLIKEKGICEYPIVASWAQAECIITAYTILSGAFGGTFVDEANNPTLDCEGNRAALQFMVDCVNNGLYNPNSIEMIEDDVLNTFCAGSAAFAINWTYMNSTMNDESQSSIAGHAKIAPIPGQGDIVSSTVNGGMPLMITAGCTHPDEAWEYMLALSSKENQATYCKNALPIWKSLYTEQQVIDTAGAELVEASGIQFDYIVNRPQVPYYSELSTYMQSEIQKALLGNESVEDALGNMQAKAVELSAK